MNQLDTEIQHDDNLSEKTQLITSTSRKVPQQLVERSDFSIHTSFVFHVITERQKRIFNTDAINFSETLTYKSTNTLPIEKHCKDYYSHPLIREHYDPYLNYIFCKTCKSILLINLSLLFLNPVKNINTGIISKTRNPKNICLPV